MADGQSGHEHAEHQRYFADHFVVKGTEVVDQIKGVKTGSKNGHGDVPKEDVIIEKAVAL